MPSPAMAFWANTFGQVVGSEARSSLQDFATLKTRNRTLKTLFQLAGAKTN